LSTANNQGKKQIIGIVQKILKMADKADKEQAQQQKPAST
jgi:hypothetical protein